MTQIPALHGMFIFPVVTKFHESIFIPMSQKG